MKLDAKVVTLPLTILLLCAPLIALATWSVTEDIYLQSGSQGYVQSSVSGSWVTAEGRIETVWEGGSVYWHILCERGAKTEFYRDTRARTNYADFYFLLDETAYSFAKAQIELLDCYANAEAQGG